jgi:hypothetical protein
MLKNQKLWLDLFREPRDDSMTVERCMPTGVFT